MDSVDLAKKYESLLINMRRDLHRIPELDLNLPKTVAYVKGKLISWRIPYETMVNGNAVVALVKGKKEGKCIAIRADMDALPIKEETCLDFASEHEGCMHGCGHDAHTAIALTAAKILSENTDKFSGSVKFIFQPGEENLGGAKRMIDEGVLDNPKVDNIIALHVGALADKPIGSLCFREGIMMAAMDRIEIKVNGRGGHGARPQETIDPIAIAAEIILGLQKIVSREISPVDDALISICKINAGTSKNVIPNQVTMEGTVRTISEKTRDFCEMRIRGISEGIARTYGGSAEIIYDRMHPALKNNIEFTRYVKNLARKLFKDDIVELDTPTMSGEDLAFFMMAVPGTFVFLINPDKDNDGVYYPNHNSKFRLDESLFYKGLALFLEVVFAKLSVE